MADRPKVIIEMDEWESLKAKKTIPEYFQEVYSTSTSFDEFKKKVEESGWEVKTNEVKFKVKLLIEKQ